MALWCPSLWEKQFAPAADISTSIQWSNRQICQWWGSHSGITPPTGPGIDWLLCCHRIEWVLLKCKKKQKQKNWKLNCNDKKIQTDHKETHHKIILRMHCIQSLSNVSVCSSRLRVQWQNGPAREITPQPSAQPDRAPVSKSVCVSVGRCQTCYWVYTAGLILKCNQKI